MAETNASYGGFWIRFLAFLVDSVIVSVILFLLVFGVLFLGEAAAALAPAICLGVPLLYWGVMHASARQATFGKALLGMKVTDASGARIALLRSLAREVAKYISALPLLIGFILAAFTKRKQALHDFFVATTVVREGPAHVVAALVVGVFGWFAPAMLAVFLGGTVLAVMMGTMGGGMLLDAMKDAPKQQQVVKAPAAPQPKPAAAYAEAETLAARLTGIPDKPGMARVGPVVLELDGLTGGNFRIETYVPPMIPFRSGNTIVSVERVLDSKGAELYDPKHGLNSEFFERVNLFYRDLPVPHHAGTRTVHLRAGASASDAQRVEGKVKLSLPLNTQPMKFAAADVGKEQKMHGVTVKLESFGAKEAEFRRVSGEWNLLAGVTGYGSDGKAVATGMGPGSGGATKITFQSPVERFEMFIAENRAEREFPFTLTRGSAAGVQAAAAPAKPAAEPAKPAPEPVKVAAAPVKEPAKPAPPAAEPAKPAAKEPEKPAAAAPKEPAKRVARKPKPPAEEVAAALLVPSAPSAPSEPSATPAPEAPKTVAPRQAAPLQVAAAPASFEPRFNDLVTAVLYRDAKAVDELIAFGKWPDKADSGGMTPLMIAVTLGDAAIVEALLKAGANPNRPGPAGATAVSLARERNDAAMLGLLQRYARIGP